MRPEEYHCKVACGVPDAAVIRFTSGTTGSSKGVVLSNTTVAERSIAAIEGLNLAAGDSVLWVLPMAYHFVVSILTYIRFGVAIVLPRDLTAASISSTAARFSPSMIYASPDIIEALTSDKTVERLPNTTRIVSTSTGLSPSLAGAFEGKFRIPIGQLYGLIEVGLPIGNSRASAFPSNSVGTAMPHYEVAILDERGRALPANEIGRLAVRGPGMFDAYLSPYRTRDDVLVHGWFLTGDLATQDFNGAITVCGRERSVIHIAGHKVFPEEVEGILNSFPGVRSSRVYGVSQPNSGEAVIAEVSLHEGRKVEIPGLLAYAAERLSPYKIPARVMIVPAIPLTNTGKVIRAA
jgi:acyl-coenzyme A synthetase/AMP-(fatty) acid ligase